MKKVEKQLIDIFNVSKSARNPEERNKAKYIEAITMFCFRLISIFTENDHAKIVKQLYFSFDNLDTKSVVYIAEKVFTSESTLGRYRKKYCLVIEEIFAFIDGVFNYEAFMLSAFASAIK